MKNLKTVGDAIDLVVARAVHDPPSRRHHGRRRRHAAGRRRRRAARALGRGRVRHRGRRGRAAATSIPADHLSRRRSAAPTASRSSRWPPRDEALAQAGWARRAALRPRPGRLRARHRHRRARHARGPARRAARRGAEGRLAAVGPADDGQRGRRRAVDAPRPARPVVLASPRPAPPARTRSASARG